MHLSQETITKLLLALEHRCFLKGLYYSAKQKPAVDVKVHSWLLLSIIAILRDGKYYDYI